MVWKLFQKTFGKSGKDVQTRLEQAKAQLKDEPADAFSKLAVLAREGSPEAQFLVGQCYLTAQGAPPDLVEGARWVRRAGQNGWAQASFVLATLYLHGLPQEVDADAPKSIFDDSAEQTKREPDFIKAAHWAQRAAEAGYADAQALYGYILTAGPESIRNPEQALEWYRAAASNGCVQGHLGIGLAALAQAKTQEDYTAAAVELKKAADGGMGTGLYLMGVMTERGIGVPQNIPESTQYFAKAAEKKVRGAQAKYGLALLSGKGVARDAVRGETWLRRAALAGDAEAAAILGDMHGRGGEMPPNYAEAISWYRFASDQGHAASSRTLGNIYLSGVGVPKDPQAAAQWFKIAAEQGDKEATAELGNLALAGIVPTAEAAEVLECYRNAAAQDDFLAAFNVGVALAQGVGSQKNEEEALKWIRKAADKVVNAQYWYGRMLLEGRGAERNPQEGREWVEKAAETGMTEAQLAYGHLLITGTGGPKDHPQALEWYKKAADAGNVDAMFSIGAMHGGGHEIPEDLVLARSWFQQAAEGGHGLAQLMMGRYLANGIGGDKDLEAARSWYRKAEKQNILQASIELSKIGVNEGAPTPS
ncbi:tetratricopeptide repeat protein [Acetobacter ascendens]|uniref:Secretory immunoglobulin A-binding protein EsiB n=1 Tax=Acetobacter ascendens TaxID=481146 RepID=A0A1D8QZ85_9PROT|nr:tetratricopeptide repeat protein [Acetobacter ascendens]AOW47646.1 hypothetical protein A4S02_13620 [Acetobacter ascendens]AOW48892.1 hypothetical protein A4R89_05045 [Acetobacter ascendens]